MWTLHNAIAHGAKAETDADTRIRLMRKIEHLHTFKKDVVPTHIEALFIADLPTKLADVNFNLQRWIDDHEAHIYDSKRQQKTRPIKGMSHLSKWFTVIRKPRLPPKPKLRTPRAKRAQVQSNKIDKYGIRLRPNRLSNRVGQ